ncbi:MAG: hypothetical protein ABGX20_05210 [Bacillus sp. (in: firmicutes)]
MEPRQPGNKKMPDFDELNDRMIAERSSSPMLVIKTNLDPENPSEENPYYQKGNAQDKEAMDDFFGDKRSQES